LSGDCEVCPSSRSALLSDETVRFFAKSASTGTRRFIYFQDAELRNVLRDFRSRVRRGSPQIWRARNTRLTPIVYRKKKAAWAGGVEDRSGLLQSLMLFRGYGNERTAYVIRRRDRNVAEPVRLARAWFGGYLSWQYGHFLTESLARVLTEEVARSSDPIVFFNLVKGGAIGAAQIRDFPAYMLAAFRLVGIHPDRIVQCTAPLLIDDLRVQDPAFELRGFILPEPYKRIQVTGSAPVKGKILYLSRTMLPYRKRVAEQEKDLEAHLRREFGAEIVYPETLPFEEQIAKLSAAEVVIGCEGSAFHTMMFLRNAPHIVMLCKVTPHPNYLLWDELFAGQTSYVLSTGESAQDIQRKGDWQLDVERAMTAIDHALNGARSDSDSIEIR
jgi:capsular polysaccharide biosynthesis protein